MSIVLSLQRLQHDDIAVISRFLISCWTLEFPRVAGGEQRSNRGNYYTLDSPDFSPRKIFNELPSSRFYIRFLSGSIFIHPKNYKLSSRKPRDKKISFSFTRVCLLVFIVISISRYALLPLGPGTGACGDDLFARKTRLANIFISNDPNFYIWTPFRFFWFEEKKKRNDSRNKYHTIEYASRYINGIHKFFPISEIGIELRKETVLVRSCSGIDERGERHEFEYRRLRCALYERTGGLLA